KPEGTEAEREMFNELSGRGIGACIEIHKEPGPGLLESAYEECLVYELSRPGIQFERQKPVPVRYKEVVLDCGYRVDFVVEGELIVELKTVTELHPVHEAQLLTLFEAGKEGSWITYQF